MTTAYPTQPENYGLNVIRELRELYGITIGYSDHFAKIETCLTAAALDAEILEFHAVFSWNSLGHDVGSSLEMDEIIQMVKALRNIETALQHPVDKSDISNFTGLKNIFEKSMAVNKDLKVGYVLRFEDMEAKKPKGFGMDASRFEEVIGLELKKDMIQWDFLNGLDL